MKPKPDALDIGLGPGILQKLNGVFDTYEGIEAVVLYGSRAKGTYHAGSDIDITIKGEKITDSLVGKIGEDLDDLLLPYTFDISSWARIDNAELRGELGGTTGTRKKIHIQVEKWASRALLAGFVENGYQEELPQNPHRDTITDSDHLTVPIFLKIWL